MSSAMALPIPAAYSLDSYIQTVNRYPMLSLEEVDAGYDGVPIISNVKMTLRPGARSRVEAKNPSSSPTSRRGSAYPTGAFKRGCRRARSSKA